MVMKIEISEKHRELLEMLAEEAAEVVQAVNKILRHGWGSYDPTLPKDKRIDNRQHLSDECIEFMAIHAALVRENLLRPHTNVDLTVAWEKKLRYTHFQDKSPDDMRAMTAKEIIEVELARTKEEWLKTIPSREEEFIQKRYARIDESREDLSERLKKAAERTLQKHEDGVNTEWANDRADCYSGIIHNSPIKPLVQPTPDVDNSNGAKLHWYCFTYHYEDNHSRRMASTYEGYGKMPSLTSRSEIDRIKKCAGLPQSSVLINIAYLGHGTYKEFINEPAGTAPSDPPAVQPERLVPRR